MSIKLRLTVSEVLRIMAMRMYFYLGWPGCLGLFLLVLSCGGWIWLHRPVTIPTLAATSADVTTTSSSTTPLGAVLTPPALPHATNTLEILRRIKGITQANGLSWPQADYKLTPLSEEGLASLEIRTTFKGPYPKVRNLITALLDKEPALAMRELTLTRPNGDAVDVEAKIRWAVFLADGWAPAEQGAKP